jgi:hypothetical protein
MVAIALGATIVVLLVVTQRFALRDLRVLEADYIAAREPTACATQGLTPFAFGEVSFPKLDAALDRLVRQAGDQSSALRDRFHRRHVVPLPPVRSARAALADALDAQVALYAAMRDDPAHSEDELRTLGLANTRVERRFAALRRELFVGRPPGWGRRFMCDEAAPPTPAGP